MSKPLTLDNSISSDYHTGDNFQERSVHGGKGQKKTPQLEIEGIGENITPFKFRFIGYLFCLNEQIYIFESKLQYFIFNQFI